MKRLWVLGVALIIGAVVQGSDDKTTQLTSLVWSEGNEALFFYEDGSGDHLRQLKRSSDVNYFLWEMEEGVLLIRGDHPDSERKRVGFALGDRVLELDRPFPVYGSTQRSFSGHAPRCSLTRYEWSGEGYESIHFEPNGTCQFVEEDPFGHPEVTDAKWRLDGEALTLLHRGTEHVVQLKRLREGGRCKLQLDSNPFLRSLSFVAIPR